MAVDVKRKHHAGMSEPFAHYFWILASRKQERGARVAQIIQPDGVRQLGAREGRFEVSAHKIAYY